MIAHVLLFYGIQIVSQVSGIGVFPARMKSHSFFLGNSSYVTTEDGISILILRNITREDSLWINYRLETGVDYDQQDYISERIMTGENVEFCSWVLDDEQHRQAFQIFMAVLPLKFSEGCPIPQQRVLINSEIIYMNVTYAVGFLRPSCGDVDELTIDIYSPESERDDPVLSASIVIAHEDSTLDCVYEDM
ncbi:uncharacterized protein LOC135162177 [Diachasmimorpha longicaudata]|uniref:uncharacterized protein LOC135162177 n=1 Tax=Diachasmimorpha longicaudata TaxID=58733 RepID=UPI0030B91A23